MLSKNLKLISVLSLLLALGVITSACEHPPEFLTASNVDAPLLTNLGTQDPVHRYGAPGILNVGAKRPSEQLLLYSTLGAPHENRDLFVYDQTRRVYRSVLNDPVRAARAMKDYIEILPAVRNINNLVLSWDITDPKFPILVIELSSAMNNSLAGAGTLYSFKFFTTALDGTPVFRVFDTGSSVEWLSSRDNRLYYVRAGRETDVTGPTVTDFTLDTASGDAVVEFDQELGAAAVAYVPMELVGSTLEPDLANMIVGYNDASENGFDRTTGAATYTFHVPSQTPLTSGAPYTFVVWQLVDDLVLFLGTPALGQLDATQDESGNAVQCGVLTQENRDHLFGCTFGFTVP